MSLTTTRAPSWAKRRAIPSPKPDPAPVTIAVLPCSLMPSPASLVVLPERAMFAQLVDVACDAAALSLEEVLHRAREARIGEPVRRQGLHRHQPAEDLVL